MALRCWLYRLLDRSRRSPLVSKTVYGGDHVQTFGPITIVGVVTRAAQPETDGDCTFDVMAGGQTWHCELTPCQSKQMRAIACSLQVGWKVRVGGTERWDPAHLGGAGHWEVHPVDTIVRQIGG